MGIGSSIAHQRDVRANVANLDSMHSPSHFSGGQLAMTGFDQGVLEFQHTQDRLNGIVVTVWIVHLLVALIAARWIYRDAQARGKSAWAAAILMIVSTLGYGLGMTIMVICTWILIRPSVDASRRNFQDAIDILTSGQQLPNELPSGVVPAPSPAEFLKDLEQRHDPPDSPESSDMP